MRISGRVSQRHRWQIEYFICPNGYGRPTTRSPRSHPRPYRITRHQQLPILPRTPATPIAHTPSPDLCHNPHPSQSPTAHLFGPRPLPVLPLLPSANLRTLHLFLPFSVRLFCFTCRWPRHDVGRCIIKQYVLSALASHSYSSSPTRSLTTSPIPLRLRGWNTTPSTENPAGRPAGRRVWERKGGPTRYTRLA